MIGLINYDGGNYKSVSNILEYLDINFLEINHDQDLNRWLKYTGITEEEFDTHAETFSDARVWLKNDKWIKN